MASCVTILLNIFLKSFKLIFKQKFCKLQIDLFANSLLNLLGQSISNQLNATGRKLNKQTNRVDQLTR